MGDSVKEAYAALEQVRKQLIEAQKELDAAMARHYAGGPRPHQLEDLVKELRRKADDLFASAAEAVRDRDAGEEARHS